MKKNYFLLALLAIFTAVGLTGCNNNEQSETFEEEKIITRSLTDVEIPGDWQRQNTDPVVFENLYDVEEFKERIWYVDSYVGGDTEESITAAIGEKYGQVWAGGFRIVQVYFQGNIYKTPNGTLVKVVKDIVISFRIVHNGGSGIPM